MSKDVGLRPVCPICGAQLVWDKRIEWYCDSCEQALAVWDDDRNLTYPYDPA